MYVKIKATQSKDIFFLNLSSDFFINNLTILYTKWIILLLSNIYNIFIWTFKKIALENNFLDLVINVIERVVYSANVFLGALSNALHVFPSR